MTKLRASFIVVLVAVIVAGLWLLSGKPAELVAALQPLVALTLIMAGLYFMVDRVCDTIDKKNSTATVITQTCCDGIEKNG